VTYRLFLSHSTPPEARERLPEIAAAIEAASGGVVRVLYDQEQIAGGDEWRRRIGYLLHACDGAAILLDDAALASDWVRAEAVFLSLRATYDDDFRVVPVSALPVDELTERLKGPGWHPVALLDRQFARAGTTDEIAEQVCKGLTAKGPLPHGSSLMERLADQIEQLLREAPRTALRDLADELGTDVPYDAADDHVRSALVIARRLVRDPCLAPVVELLQGLGPRFMREYALDVLEYLRPLPIDPEAAAWLRQPRPGGGLGHSWLQAEKAQQTVALYVARAYLTYGPPPLVVIVPENGTAAETRAALRREIVQTLWPEDAGLLDDDEVDEVLRGLKLYVCSPPLDGEVVRELSDDYPFLGFVFHHTEDDVTQPPAGVNRVEPVLRRTDEGELRRQWLLAMAAVRANQPEGVRAGRTRRSA
jgi:hypothetical protein